MPNPFQNKIQQHLNCKDKQAGMQGWSRSICIRTTCSQPAPIRHQPPDVSSGPLHRSNCNTFVSTEFLSLPWIYVVRKLAKKPFRFFLDHAQCKICITTEHILTNKFSIMCRLMSDHMLAPTHTYQYASLYGTHFFVCVKFNCI